MADPALPLTDLVDRYLMVFGKIQDELGLAAFHPNELRHQAATMLVRNRVDLESVRPILDHADISTTDKYLSMSDTDLRNTHAVASPFESLALGRSLDVVRPRRRRLSLSES